jgi:hypothetical protein
MSLIYTMDTGDRSFKVLSVKKPNQDMRATTKKTGRYISKSPDAAAKKALTNHCNAKKIKGACTLVIVMRETTAGSAHKVFTYKGTRRRVDKVVMYKGKEVLHKYENKVRSVATPKYVQDV